MHTEQTANFSVRIAYADLGLGPHDVVWMPSPVGHSTGFNYGLRFALFHGLKLVLQEAWNAEDAARARAARACSYTLAATTFLQDLVGGGRARPASGSTRSAASAAAARRSRPPSSRPLAERGIGVLRLYGSTEVLVGTWNRPASPLDEATPHRRRGHDQRRAPGARRRRSALSRWRAGRALRARAQHLRWLLRRPRAHGRDLRTRRLGALRRSRDDRRRWLPHRGRAQEGDHHPRRHEHRAARDRGAARGTPRGRARRRRRDTRRPAR